MMLQTDSRYWPDTILYGSRGILENTDPFTPVIQRYLPEVESTLKLIDSRQARLRLVAMIEHARGAEAAGERAQETQPEELRPPSTPLATPDPSGAATTPAKPATTLAGEATGKSELWLWVTTAIGAFVAAAVLLVLRHRHKHIEPH
jgi:hypothetical protein